MQFRTAWSILLLVFAVSFVGLGVWIRKHPLGILVDTRNRMSLSRLQVVAWTWLLVSAFFAVALTKVRMDILMQPELWALMGISVASAAGSVIVKGTKSAQEADMNRMSNQAPDQVRQGVLAVYQKPTLADLFKGEELTDNSYVDIGKVQMSFFTVAVLVGYGFALWKWHWPIGPDVEDCKAAGICFPPLSETLVALLAISHAGYLSVKASPKTPTTPPPPPTTTQSTQTH